MTWDQRIARIAPATAVAIAMLATFITFAAYIQ